MLSKAPPGHVLVCQPNNHEVALMGELSAETLKNKGVLGYVVDGGCRDTDFILEQQAQLTTTVSKLSDTVGELSDTVSKLSDTVDRTAGSITALLAIAEIQSGEIKELGESVRAIDERQREGARKSC